MSFNPVIAAIKTRIRIDHLRRRAILAVKNVKIAIYIRLQRQPDAISVMKLARGFDPNAAAIGIAHE